MPATPAPDTQQTAVARPPSQPLPVQGAPTGRFGMHNGPPPPPTFVRLPPNPVKSKSKKVNVALADPRLDQRHSSLRNNLTAGHEVPQHTVADALSIDGPPQRSHFSTAKPFTVISLPLRSMLSSAQACSLQPPVSGSHRHDSSRRAPVGPTRNVLNQLGSPLTPIPDEEMGRRDDDEEEEMNGIRNDGIPMEYGDEDEDGQATGGLDWAEYNFRDEEDGMQGQRAGADSEGNDSIVHLSSLLLMSPCSQMLRVVVPRNLMMTTIVDCMIPL